AEVVAPDAVVDGGVVEHDPGVAHQQFQQLELGAGQLQLALPAPGASRLYVHPQSGRLDLPVGGRGRLLRYDVDHDAVVRAAAAQQGPEPGEDLLDVEGLDHVVVGAGVEAGDTVGGLDEGGQHEDRRAVALGAQ